MWARRYKTAAFPAVALDSYKDVCNEFGFPEACFLMRGGTQKEEQKKDEPKENQTAEKDKKAREPEEEDNDSDTRGRYDKNK